MAERAALYTRLSDPSSRDSPSLDAQEAQCRAYCEERGYVVVAVLRENYTGAVLRERPRIRDLLTLLQERALDVVVIRDLDRLAREQWSVGIFMDICRQHGARVEFALETFEDTSTGKLLLNVKAFAAEYEREKIAWRTTTARRRLVEDGYPYVGCKPPHGLARDGRGMKAPWLVNELEAGTVRRLFAMAADGQPAREIAATLQAEGVPTPSGRGHWHKNSVLRMIRNPAYYGSPASYRTKTDRVPGRQGLRQRPRPLAEWVTVQAPDYPVLVARAVWDAANRGIEANRGNPPLRKGAPLLLRGRAYCASCGTRLTTASHSPTATGFQYWYYRCVQVRRVSGPDCPAPVTVGAVRLDATAWQYAVAALTGNLDTLLATAQRRRGKVRVQAQPGTERQRAELDRQISNLSAVIARADDAGAQDALLVDLRRLTAQRRALVVLPPPVTVHHTPDVRALRDAIAAVLRDSGDPSGWPFERKRRALAVLDLTATIPPREGERRPPPVFACAAIR